LRYPTRFSFVAESTRFDKHDSRFNNSIGRFDLRVISFSMKTLSSRVVSVFLLLAVAIPGFAVAVRGVEDARFVTCGSAIRIRNIDSRKYFLGSSEHQYSHNGQQVVTLDTRGDQSKFMWQIQAAHNNTCVTGEKIKCGEIIRLTHVGTGKNLHSHGLPAPLTRGNTEVSGFGNDGEGDAGDNWKLECVHRKDAGNAQHRLWESTTLVRLLHVDTKHWLSSSTKTKFNQSNCPNCPLQGELEVSGTNSNSDAAIFRSDDGAYLRL